MENLLAQIINYLLTQSWQIAVLIAAITVVSLALKNKSAHIRYLLWLIVLTKCLVPPLLTIPLAILPQGQSPETIAMSPAPMSTVTAEAVDISSTEPIVLSSGLVTEPTVLERLAEVTAQQWLGFAWVIGATMFALIAVIKALRVNCWLRKERKQLPDDLQVDIENLFSGIGVKTFPKVWLIDGIGQPFVWGLLRGGIYLPGNFAKVDSKESYRSILGHELSHILRFDAAVNLLQIIAQGVFWFHPFVWWANKKIRAEREKCCDETAVAGFGVKCKDYSTAIINTLIAEHKSAQPIPSLAIAGPVKNIEERIKTIMKPGKKFYKRAGLKAVITILMLALIAVPTTLALTTRTGNKTEKIDYSSVTIEEGVGFDDIIVADSKCSREFVKSKLGKPDEDAKDTKTNGWWLNYGKKYGIDFWLNKNDTLREIRINKGFKGELTSGISMASTKQDVFKTYGEPVSEKTVADLTKHSEDQVLYKKIMEERFFRKQEYSKIFYNQNGLLFWFKGDKINQIVIHPKENKAEVQVDGESGQVESHLEILDVKFEPIHQGKNVVRVKVKNNSEQKQMFRLQIYTRSPDYGPQGIGWGTSFFDSIKPKEAKWTRFAFKIQGPVTDATYVRLDFHNPGPSAGFDKQKWLQKRDKKKWFKRIKYSSSDLEHRENDEGQLKPASKKQAEQVTQAFKRIQSYIRDKKYEQAWMFFTEDYQNAEFQIRGFEGFRKIMEPVRPLDSAFLWKKDDFLNLKPKTVVGKDGIFTLTATSEGQNWTIDFVKEAGQWKVGWIAGYTPTIIDMQLADKKRRSEAIQATNKTDVQVEGEQANKKAVIQVEVRFLHIPADANEFVTFFEEEKIAFGAGKAVHSGLLDAEQVEQLLKLVQANPAAKTMTGPKARVFDGSFATIRTQKTIKYEYTDPNAASGKPEQKELKIGTIVKVEPTVQDDGKNILLKLDFEHTNLLGFEDGLPQTDITRIKTRVLVPSGQTLVLGGQRITDIDEEDGRSVSKVLICLVKAEKLEPADSQTAN